MLYRLTGQGFTYWFKYHSNPPKGYLKTGGDCLGVELFIDEGGNKLYLHERHYVQVTDVEILDKWLEENPE